MGESNAAAGGIEDLGHGDGLAAHDGLERGARPIHGPAGGLEDALGHEQIAQAIDLVLERVEDVPEAVDVVVLQLRVDGLKLGFATVVAGQDVQPVHDVRGGQRLGRRSRRDGCRGQRRGRAQVVDEAVEAGLVQTPLQAVAEQGGQRLALTDAVDQSARRRTRSDDRSSAKGSLPFATRCDRWALARTAAALAWAIDGAWMKPSERTPALGSEIFDPAVAAKEGRPRPRGAERGQSARGQRGDPGIEAMRGEVERADQQPFERLRLAARQSVEAGAQLAQLQRVGLVGVGRVVEEGADARSALGGARPAARADA